MDEKKEFHKYDDIINLPHPVSKTHPRMSLHDRAAQFSAFAARPDTKKRSWKLPV